MGKLQEMEERAFAEMEAVAKIFSNNMANGYFDLDIRFTVSVIFRADKQLKKAIEAQLVERYGSDGFKLKKVDEPENTYRLELRIR